MECNSEPSERCQRRFRQQASRSEVSLLSISEFEEFILIKITSVMSKAYQMWELLSVCSLGEKNKQKVQRPGLLQLKAEKEDECINKWILWREMAGDKPKLLSPKLCRLYWVEVCTAKMAELQVEEVERRRIKPRPKEFVKTRRKTRYY
eukprot:gene20115-22086_t